MPLIDRYGRQITGLRISVNQECNLNCVFCHREGASGRSGGAMRPEEIERITRIAMGYGVDSVKITGGEPLLRPDILEIVERLGKLGLRDLSMTTNGYRLSELAGELKRRGLMRINISLHAADPRKFAWMAGFRDPAMGENAFEEVLEGIERSIEAGLDPIKLNVVVMKGVNDGDLWDLVALSERLNSKGKIVLQLIELVSCGTAPNMFAKYHCDLTRLEGEVSAVAVERVARKLHLRTQYLLPNGVWVEFVKPMNNGAFCMNDTRLRITHDGSFKPCLMRDDNHVPFLGAMRSGATDEELKKIFLRAVEAREPYWKT